MKKTILQLAFSLLLILLPISIYAQDDTADNNGLSFGIAGTLGMVNVWTRSGQDTWGKGVLSGGGFIMEKMFGDHVGLFSALLFERNIHNLEFTDPLNPTFKMHADWVHWRMTIPACLLTSVNAGFFSLQFLTGINLSYMMTSKLSPDNSKVPDRDVVKFLNYYGVGLTGGINTLYRVGTYTDLFLGFIGELTLTNLSNPERGDDKAKDNMWDAKIIAGIMFRTSLFPSN